MSEIFKDNSQNKGYLKAASELYTKAEDLFSTREVPVTNEEQGGMREVVLKDTELAFANSVFETEGLGPVDAFKISEVVELHDVVQFDEITDIEPGSSTILITTESGPVEYTYYIGKGDGDNITMFEKEVAKNPNYNPIDTAEGLRVALEEGRDIDSDEPSGWDKLFADFEAADAGTDKLSLEEQRAIESILDHLAPKV